MRITIFLLFISVFSYAQNIDYNNYQWDKKPSYEVPTVDGDDSEVVIKQKRVLEFTFDNNAFVHFDLLHKITYIASEAGVEDNNKIYLTTRSDQEVVYQKARVINSKGEVIEFDENDIKEGEDEESGLVYNYFALDGLDIGSFVEIQFLVKKMAGYSGRRQILQSSVPKYNVEFELIAPDHLIFDFKSLNGLPAMNFDTTDNEKNYWSVRVDSMPKFESEPMFFVSSNLQGVVYKLDENTYNGNSDVTSYGEVAKNYYNVVYASATKKDKKKVKKLLKKIGITEEMSDEEKILTFENHVKSSYAIIQYVPEQYQNINALLSNNASDGDTFIRLYAEAFDQMGIKNEVVLTSDRSSIRFDEEFEAYNYLQATLFYFRGLDKYLAPESEELRLGFAPYEYMNNYGLFIKALTIGDITTGLGKIKFIEPLGYKASGNDHYVKVDMTEDPFEPTIDFEIRMSGYYSSFIQTSYNLLSDDERERLDESLIEMVTNEKAETELVVENGNAESFGKKPMILKATAQSEEVCEKAGNKVIFKIGTLIGRQVELYNEKPRQHPVQEDYKRTFYREIEVTLPEGYKVSNLDKLNFDMAMSDSSCIFKSYYTLEGNHLKVVIDEYYDKVNYTLEEYPEYESIVNAAADFNKVVLYLEEEM